MKKGLLVAISTLFAIQIQLKAQENIVVLHPLVGSTIDKTEIGKYTLFAEYSNDNIDYFIVSTNKEKTYLLGVNGEKIIFNAEIGTDYLSKQRENIEKINNDNSSLSKPDSTSFSIHKNDFINGETIKTNPAIMTPEMRKSIKQHINQEQSLKRSKEYEEDQKKGFNLKKF